MFNLPIALQIAIIAALLVLSGLLSGLNLGLISLTLQELELISESGSEVEKQYAQKILPVRKLGTRLLCGLILINVCINSAVTILLDDIIINGYVALAVSSMVIVVFGEIIPQAFFHKQALSIGAKTIWITRFLNVLTFPLAYPIAKALDYIFGDEAVTYDRKRLMELVKLTTKNAEEDEAVAVKIALGAFEMSNKTVKEVMTKIEDVFKIRQDTVLNKKMANDILNSGYTRIPVYDADNGAITSLLFDRDLAFLDPGSNFTAKTVCDYYQHKIARVADNTSLRAMLEEFKKGDYHLALVTSTGAEAKNEVVGLVTLEDIVEEILQAEIIDETDVVQDNVTRIKRQIKRRRIFDSQAARELILKQKNIQME